MVDGEAGWFGRLIGDAQVAFASRVGDGLAGTVDVGAESGRLRVSSSRLDLGGTRASVEGAATTDSLEGVVRASTSDLGELTRRFAAAPQVSLEGPADLGLILSGRPSEPRVIASVEAPRLAVQYGRLKVGPLRTLANGVVSRDGIDDLTLTALGPLGSLTAQGRVALTDQGEWDLSMRLEGLDLCRLLGRDESVSTCWTGDGTGRIEGPLGAPEWRLAGQIGGGAAGRDAVTFMAVGFPDRMSATLDGPLAGGSVEAEVEVAGGEIQGTARIDGVRFEETIEGRSLQLVGAFDANLRISGELTSPGVVLEAGLRSTALAENVLPDLDIVVERIDAQTEDLTIRVAEPGLPAFAEGSGSSGGEWPLRLEVDLQRAPLQAAVGMVRPLRVERVAARGRAWIELPILAPEKISYRAVIEQLSVTAGGIDLESDPFELAGDETSMSVEEIEFGEAAPSFCSPVYCRSWRKGRSTSNSRALSIYPS